MNNTNRDPADARALAAAVTLWNEVNPTDDATEANESDIALEAVLLEQGVISPADVVAYFSHDHGCAVYVRMLTGESFIVRADGSVDGAAA